jgi:hypothetical protein
MTRKRDIKQFRQACREAGLTVSERCEASQALHAEKGTGGGQDDMSYGETAGMAATMEGLMATVVALDASPTTVLRSMRGSIIDARIAYPDVLQVEVRDSSGEIWRLATQDAEFSPADPAQLVGRSIDDADIDEESGELRCRLSDGSVLDIKPAAPETEEDPPYWELISPAGVVLEFGPGVRWQISGADAPTSRR